MNTQSNFIDVLSGVPQCIHLEPLLYTLFINHLPSVIRNSNTLMYADDVKIFFSFNNIEHQVLIQVDINYWVCHLTFFLTSAYFMNGNT